MKYEVSFKALDHPTDIHLNYSDTSNVTSKDISQDLLLKLLIIRYHGCLYPNELNRFRTSKT